MKKSILITIYVMLGFIIVSGGCLLTGPDGALNIILGLSGLFFILCINGCYSDKIKD